MSGGMSGCKALKRSSSVDVVGVVKVCPPLLFCGQYNIDRLCGNCVSNGQSVPGQWWQWWQEVLVRQYALCAVVGAPTRRFAGWGYKYVSVGHNGDCRGDFVEDRLCSDS